MTSADPAQTLCFNASFPSEEQYVQTAGELAGKMAVSAGVTEDEAGSLARQVEGAFSKVLSGDAQIELGLCAGPESVDVTVTSGGTTLLNASRPRPR